MALDAGLRDVLQSLESDISITIQLPCLLPFLRRKRLVTQSELQQLSSDGKESDLEKNRKLIRIITGKGENAYDLFIEALQEEGEHLGHASLVKKLMDEKKKIKSAVCPPEPPTTPTPTFPPKSNALQEQQDPSPVGKSVKYNVSVVEGHNVLQGYPLIMTDDKLMKDLTARLSSVERNVDTIVGAINSTSLEGKLGKAIEIIESKLDELTSIIKESPYSTITDREASQPPDKDETYVYAVNNDYTDEQLYDTVAELSVKIEHPKSRSEYDYATTYHGPVGRYMTLCSTNRDSSDGPYHYTRTIKQPRQHQQIKLVEEERLANGKNGEVWLAVDKEGTKMVIKKFFSKEIFMKEKNTLTQISHPNVIRLISSSLAKQPVLIFEYAENGNLHNHLKSCDSSFNISNLLEISAGVAHGMLELEKRGIIHCDILAMNILIDGHFVCKVAGFSKARCLKPGESSYISPSNVRMMVATKWAAPEILSKRRFSVKSDVWAFAVLLSEVFSQGAFPYPNMSNAEVKSGVQKGIKMAQPSGCPNEVYELMKCCFELHAKNRPSFATIRERLNDIHRRESMSEESSGGSDGEDV